VRMDFAARMASGTEGPEPAVTFAVEDCLAED